MSENSTSVVTRLLADESLDAEEVTRRLLPLVYEELRLIAGKRIASERPGHTLDATALVHEAYLRLVGERNPRWRDRGHFFAAAAEAMRRILVDQARRRHTLKRGGDRRRLDVEREPLAAEVTIAANTVDLVALDAALVGLASEDTRKATLVKLRYFTGMTLEQAASALGVSAATADRDWAYSKAFIRLHMHGDPES
ncbi:MAG: ECF-type sigma factor [Planctomycetota bacterium]